MKVIHDMLTWGICIIHVKNATYLLITEEYEPTSRIELEHSPDLVRDTHLPPFRTR